MWRPMKGQDDYFALVLIKEIGDYVGVPKLSHAFYILL